MPVRQLELQAEIPNAECWQLRNFNVFCLLRLILKFSSVSAAAVTVATEDREKAEGLTTPYHVWQQANTGQGLPNLPIDAV